MAIRNNEKCMDSLYFIEEGKVDIISKRKHGNEDWKDMKSSYIKRKIASHLEKSGNGDGKPMLHITKIGWYAIRWLWIMKYRPEQNDLVEVKTVKPLHP